ncbi:MAG: enoyl-CoA hydratase/isomerase family protein [Elusimicrobia bacterium]|nr:enoyl-CoA hydratase/isomerase family protein [Elusimicrobiota bacterium]
MAALPGSLLQAQVAGVMTLTLNRPKLSNPLDAELIAALRDCFQEARDSAQVRCVVLTGSGRSFSCGADIPELEALLKESPHAYAEELRELLYPLILLIRGMEKPVVASVNGPAAGVGASLALACDLKVASEDATFVCSCSAVGLLPCGITGLLARQVGLSRALELAWTGRPVHSQEALSLGLVNQVVPAYRLESSTFELVRVLLEGPGRCAGLTKKAMNLCSGRSLEEELDYEAGLQDILVSAKNHQEGVAAILEKRPPVFD